MVLFDGNDRTLATVTFNTSGAIVNVVPATASVNGDRSSLEFGALPQGSYTTRASDGVCARDKTETVTAGAPDVPEISVTQPTCAELGKIAVNNPIPGEYILHRITDTSTEEIDRKTYSAGDTGDLIFESLGEGTYEVTFKSPDTNCISEPSEEVTIDEELGEIEAPDLLDVEIEACGDETTTVDLNTLVATNTPEGLRLTWHTDTPATTENEIADPTAVGPGTYHAAFFDELGGCYGDTEPVTVTITSKPEAPTVGIVAPNCEAPTGTILILDPDPDSDRYTITNENGNEVNVTGVLSEREDVLLFEGLAPGTYGVTFDDGNCVSESVSVTIPPADITPPTLIGDLPGGRLPEEEIVITSSESDLSLDIPEQPNITSSSGGAVIFEQTIDPSSTDCFTIVRRTWTPVACDGTPSVSNRHTQVIHIIRAIEVKNAISPNSTIGLNDYLRIENITCYDNAIQIFNRWGIKIFEEKNYDNETHPFIGFSEGRVTIEENERLPAGTYFYIINYKYQGTNAPRNLRDSGYIYISDN